MYSLLLSLIAGYSCPLKYDYLFCNYPLSFLVILRLEMHDCIMMVFMFCGINDIYICSQMYIHTHSVFFFISRFNEIAFTLFVSLFLCYNYSKWQLSFDIGEDINTKILFASCTDKEYMYGHYIATMTNTTKKWRGDCLANWLLLGFMDHGRRFSRHSTSVVHILTHSCKIKSCLWPAVIFLHCFIFRTSKKLGFEWKTWRIIA